MPSHFSDFARIFAAPYASDYLAERDASGNSLTIVCNHANGSKANLRNVILHQLRISDEVADEYGTHVYDQIEDVAELTIPRQQDISDVATGVELTGDYEPQINSTFELPDVPGGAFTIREVLRLTPVWVRVRATRKHVYAMRDAGSEG